MGRNHGETAQEGLIRVTHEHAEAFDEVTRLRERLGLDKEVLPGHPYPVNDDPKYDAADARVTVAEAEMNEAADAFYRERPR
jgi:hypothetical protein